VSGNLFSELTQAFSNPIIPDEIDFG